MGRACARHCVLVALLGGCGDNLGGIAAPTDVAASDGTSHEAVIITWAPVDGATSYRIWRDGSPLAVVSELVYTDTTASPPIATGPLLAASEGTYADQVELTWTLPFEPGAKHRYVVTALGDDGESMPSHPNAGFRGAPDVLRYELSTDGGATFPIVTMQRTYADTQAPPPSITGRVTASDGTSSTHIAVSVTTTSAEGAAVSYAVRAIATVGNVTSNIAEGHRGVGPLGYQWYRYDQGARVLIPSATGSSFVDAETSAGQAVAYDCTISTTSLSVTTTPDLGWRAPRPSERPRPDTWVTNRRVFDAAVAEDAIYLAGDFDYVGPPTGAFAAIDATTGTTNLTPTRVTAVDNFERGVEAAVRDGAGGWYLGGEFAAVSGVPQARLVRIGANGQPDPLFAPVIDGPVRSIAVDGNTIFIAGTFTSVDWQLRNGFAALDATTGALEPLSPTLSQLGRINSVHAAAGVLYVAGSFVSVDGVSRIGIAAIDIATGTVTSWDAGANGASIAIEATTSNTLYVTGSFTSIGGQSRNGLAELDATTGLASAFNPTQPIGVLVRSGDSIFGARVLSSTSELQLTMLDAVTGATTGMHTVAVDVSNALADVALAVSGNTLYVGGDFKIGGAKPRTRLAAFDAATGSVLDWAPIAPGPVHSIQLVNDTVYVGGAFSSVGGARRSGLAALDPTTGSLLSWDPNVESASFRPAIRALALTANTIFVGGQFDRVGGLPRKGLACLDRTSGAPTSWIADLDANASSVVANLAIGAATLYVTGWFQTIGGQTRSSIAAVDVSTASILPWNPNANPDYPILRLGKLILDGNTAYLIGAFQFIGGSARGAIAALDVATGQATSWNPMFNAQAINDLVVAGGRLYVGGHNDEVNWQPRYGLAAFDLPGGALSSWVTPMLHPSDLSALAVVGNTVYATGVVYLPNRQLNGAVSFDAATGNVATWNPSWVGSFENLGVADRIVVTGTSLLVGGNMYHVAGYPRRGIAIFDL